MIELAHNSCYIDNKRNARYRDYEDSEEHGRLIKLPCKVGDTVYYFSGGYYKNIKN
jgi:hypothetical protein